MKCMIVFSMVFCAVVSAVAELKNGSFETVDVNSAPEAWRMSGDVKVVKGVGCDNSNAAVLCGKDKKARVTQDVIVEPGKMYELSADVNVSGGDACVYAEWFDGGGKWKGGFYCSNTKDTGGKWKRLHKLSKPVEPGICRFRIQAQHTTADCGEAIVDNIVFREYVLPPMPDADTVPYRYRDGGRGRRVWIDDKNRTIVDGKKFFPLGLYASVAEEDLKRIAESPFNTVMFYSYPNREVLDRADRHSLKVIAGVNYIWADNKFRPKGIKTSADADEWLAKYVSSIKNHDALLAWYLFDEPELTEVTKFAKRRKFMETADPHHPCWGALNVPQVTAWYLDIFDVAGADPYPINRDPISKVTEWTEWVQSGTKGKRASWMIPQIFDFRNYGRKSARLPTREEIRNMTWQCIAGGANGIVYFKYGDLLKNKHGDSTFESRWADVTAVAQEVKDFEPWLLSDEEPPQIKVSDPAVRARAFRLNGEIWTVAVNISSNTVPVALSAEGILKRRSIRPLGVEIFRLDRDVELVAHQGEEHLAPSHTQAAYNLAVEHGLDYMKLDLHSTKDGVIVTQHDADLKSTYGVDVTIRENEFSEISNIKARPVGGYSNETVCTLAKALEIAKPMKGLWLDFKQFSPEFMDRVFAEVDKAGWPVGKLIVATFNHWALKWAPRKRPGIRLVAHTSITKVKGGYTLNYGEKGKVYPDEDALADAILAYAKKMKLYGVNMPAPHKWRTNRYATTRKMIKRLKDAGLWVSIWFVNKPETGAFYRDCHADAFVTACAGNTEPVVRRAESKRK